jgi:hypothetical protein
MKFKRTLACLFIVAAFPLLASTSHNNSADSAPFASVVFAGHRPIGSYYCICGCDDCICDPDEVPADCNRINNPTFKKADGSSGHSASSVPASDLDFGAGTMLLALALMVWIRLRI